MINVPKVGDLLYYGPGNQTNSVPFSLLILSEPIQENDGWRIWVLRIGGIGAKVYCGTFPDFERFEHSISE